jgi:hypothetical protein
MVEGTQILRIDFDDPDGSRDESLVRVSWDELFRVFDDRGLESFIRSTPTTATSAVSTSSSMRAPTGSRIDPAGRLAAGLSHEEPTAAANVPARARQWGNRAAGSG